MAKMNPFAKGPKGKPMKDDEKMPKGKGGKGMPKGKLPFDQGGGKKKKDC